MIYNISYVIVVASNFLAKKSYQKLLKSYQFFHCLSMIIYIL